MIDFLFGELASVGARVSDPEDALLAAAPGDLVERDIEGADPIFGIVAAAIRFNLSQVFFDFLEAGCEVHELVFVFGAVDGVAVDDDGVLVVNPPVLRVEVEGGIDNAVAERLEDGLCGCGCVDDKRQVDKDVSLCHEECHFLQDGVTRLGVFYG